MSLGSVNPAGMDSSGEVASIEACEGLEAIVLPLVSDMAPDRIRAYGRCLVGIARVEFVTIESQELDATLEDGSSRSEGGIITVREAMVNLYDESENRPPLVGIVVDDNSVNRCNDRPKDQELKRAAGLLRQIIDSELLNDQEKAVVLHLLGRTSAFQGNHKQAQRNNRVGLKDGSFAYLYDIIHELVATANPPTTEVRTYSSELIDDHVLAISATQMVDANQERVQGEPHLNKLEIDTTNVISGRKTEYALTFGGDRACRAYNMIARLPQKSRGDQPLADPEWHEPTVGEVSLLQHVATEAMVIKLGDPMDDVYALLNSQP